MMGIDRETKPDAIWITLPNKPKFLKGLKKHADEEGINEEGTHDCLITDSLGTFTPSEYYFDESNNSIHYSGEICVGEERIYTSFNIPLSDIVLKDILKYSIEKLEKLKSAMELLKSFVIT